MTIDKLIGARLRRALKDEPRGGAGFGERLVAFLGTEWTKQTVYDACQGLRKFRVAELVAIARATNRPVHFFLDADAEGIAAIEVATQAPAIEAASLRNMFRIAEPRDLEDTTRLALDYMDSAVEDLEAQARDLKWAAARLRGDQL